MPRTFTVLATLTFSTTLATGGCGAAASTTSERDADVYAAVIRSLVSEGLGDEGIDEGIDEEGDPDRVVWTGPLEDEPAIPLEVQAAVVEALEGFVTVRFVDEWDEAVDATDDGPVILEDGLLVLLGSVPDGASPSLRAEHYVEVDRGAVLQVHAEEQAEEWGVTLERVSRSRLSPA